MNPEAPPLNLSGVRGAVVAMPCATLEPTLSFFTRRLGFRVDAIFPAESPRTAFVSGHGVTLRLAVGGTMAMPALTLLCDDPQAVAGGERELQAPNGAVIRLSAADPAMVLPPTRDELVVSRASEEAPWTVGRAGLRYRDLLPARHGGAFVASHIRILEGGPVADYVHYHKVRFQMIYCRKGWVRVVYEGQGAPFLLQAGDCVLQPPMIRHRVLESSASAEVVEVSSPAEHITLADHALQLPCGELPADHDFGGQRFVRHIAQQASWAPWRVPGFEVRDTGIAAATDGLAGARVVRLASSAAAAAPAVAQRHATEFCFYFVLAGRTTFAVADRTLSLGADDSITVPGDAPYALLDPSADLELLEVTLPGSVQNLAAAP